MKSRTEATAGKANPLSYGALETANLCPFTTENLTWQSQDGAWTLTVCVRGTFSLIHGREAVLADAQEPISIDRHYDNDPRQGLYTPSDLVPYKPRTDVILVGSAFAPDRGMVEALIARIAFDEIDKSVGVIGDRRWIEGPDGLEPSPPEPFHAMALRNELAARTADNPGGFDLTAPSVAGAPALPNLEAIDDRPEDGRVIGFGALPPSASSRRSLLTPDGWAWLAGGGAGPAPPGFDFGFYNAAPPDQQIGLLRSRSTIILENLHREHARFEVKLPSVRPKVFLVSQDAERAIEVAMRCDTLWIDTDRAVMSLSWRGIIGIGAAETQGLNTVLVAAEVSGRELRYRQIQRMLRDGVSVTLDGDVPSDTPPPDPRRDAIKESFLPPAAPSHVSIGDRASDPTIETLRMERPLTLTDIELVSEPGVPLTMADIELVSEPGVPILMNELELVSEPGLWEEVSASEIADPPTQVPAPKVPEAPKTIDLHDQRRRLPEDLSEIVSDETVQDYRSPTDFPEQE